MTLDSGQQTATSRTEEVKDAAAGVAAEATQQAKVVALQAKEQVSQLLDQTRDEVRTTAEEKGRQAAGSLRSLAGQLRALSEGRPEEATQIRHYFDEAEDRLTSYATRLETQGPQALVGDMKRFARQRPMVFLGLAAGAGFLIGRMVRAGAAAAEDQASSQGYSATRSLGTSATTRNMAPTAFDPPEPTWSGDGHPTRAREAG